jgi:uncharacterized protein (TIGR02270 family)
MPALVTDPEPRGPAAPTPSAALLWDVMEEHFEEAAFAVGRFARGLDSSILTLHDLGRDAEHALVAHVDALVLGQEEVRDQLLRPAVEAAGPDSLELAAAAALVLMESGEFAELLPLLGHELPAVRDAVALAGRFCTHTGLEPWLGARVERPLAPSLRAGILTLGSARGRLLQPVIDALQSEDPGLVVAAARAARHGDPEQYLPVMDYLLQHPARDVRDAALLAGLAWGSQQAWASARRWAMDPMQPSAFATRLVAALGSQADQQELAELVAEPSTRHEVLFALGFSGDATLAPALTPFLDGDDPLLARVAAQSLALIFGFDPSDDRFALPAEPPRPAGDTLPAAEEDPEAHAALPPLEQDDLEADLVPLPEEQLPAPNSRAIRAFCAAQGEAPGRLLYGAPHGIERVVDVLARRPTRVRHVLAAGLFVRSTGTMFVDTSARTSVQRAQLSAITPRALSRFLTW